MKQKFIVKLMAISLVCMPIFGSNLTQVNAEQITTGESVMIEKFDDEVQAVNTLTTYLNAFTNFDVNTIMSVSEDIRNSNSDEYIDQLNGFESDINCHLKSYKIKDIKSVNNTSYKINAEVEFMNGYVYSQEFDVIKDSNWKVILGKEVSVDEFNKTVLKEGNIISNNKLLRASSLVRWDFDISNKNSSNGNSSTTSSFSMTTSSIKLNYRQYAIAGSGALSTKYEIVGGVFSSTKASKTIKTSNKDSSEKFTLSIGDGQTLSSAKLKVTNNSSSDIRSFGEVYKN